MNKKLFLTCLILHLSVIVQTGIYAQPPQGRPGGAGREMMGPPPGAMRHGEPDEFLLEHFPDIPGISLKQRADVGIILLKEQKEIDKQIQKKRQFMEKSANEKDRKKIEKTDQKIRQIIDKSNKKVRKILSEEQYRIFIEKRTEFQFRKDPPMHFNGAPNARPGGERPPNGGRPPGGGGGGRYP